jgi:hypothetical protein
VPTTPFLIGASTEASGAKSQGVVRIPEAYLASDPALPKVVAQAGFISAESAGNYAQGIINDYAANDDVTNIQVSLRTEKFGPIGCSGTPKLGETVRVVVNRKSVGVGSDQVSSLYNVGGMTWLAKVDGTERLILDLVKPVRFKGPSISWESKPTPTPKNRKPVPADNGGNGGNGGNNFMDPVKDDGFAQFRAGERDLTYVAPPTEPRRGV